MSTQILINATYPEEVRVAIKKNNELFNYDNDRLDNINKKGCIFKGVVSRVEPSLDAAFIDYGRAKHGFLPLSEVMRSHERLDTKTSDTDEQGKEKDKKPGIGSYLKEGQSVIVQVEKDERGTKGAALTTNISLAGCFVVLMPNTAGAGGISRQIEGEQRDQLKRILNQIDVSSKHSLILRTASVNRTLEELLWDYNVLVSHWDAITQVAHESKKPLLLYKEGALLQRTIRDFLKPDVDAILVDTKESYEEVLALVQNARPDFLEKVKLYEDKNRTLFDAHDLEYDVESLYNSEVSLSNGATLVIDHCEALTAIDINSAKATKSADIDETAFNINKAAAYEIARQIRLRNLGGQIVIDFIDMTSAENRREVEKVIKHALEDDKARIQLGSICDKLGLMALSRQRMNTSLDESSLIKCSNCHGHGVHRRPVSVALSLVRLLKSQALKESGQPVQFVLKCGTQIAELLYNNYRTELTEIESHFTMPISIKITNTMGDADFEIETKRKASASKVYRNFEKKSSSHDDDDTILIPAVKAFTPKPKKETEKTEEKLTILARIYNAFFGKTAKGQKSESQDGQKRRRRYNQRSSNNRRNNQNRSSSQRRHNSSTDGSQKEDSRNTRANHTPSQDKNGNVKESSGENRNENRGNNQRRRRSSNPNYRRRQNNSNQGSSSQGSARASNHKVDDKG